MEKKFNLEYLRGLGQIHDFEFDEICKKNNITEEQLIEDMVNAGWTISKDDAGHNIFYESDEQN